MKLRLLATGLLLTATPSFAQAPPSSIDGVISVCSPVIDEEYKGVTERWGTCMQATANYLTVVYGPPPTAGDPNEVAVNTIVALAKLYRAADCPTNPTELPQAIRRASSFLTDRERQVQVEDIARTISDCSAAETGAIGDPVAVSPA